MERINAADRDDGIAVGGITERRVLMKLLSISCETSVLIGVATHLK